MSISLEDLCLRYHIPYNILNQSRKYNYNLAMKIARIVDNLKIDYYDPDYININNLNIALQNIRIQKKYNTENSYEHSYEHSYKPKIKRYNSY